MFSFDFLTVNILHLNRSLQPVGEITSEVAYAAENSKATYENNLTYDTFRPLTMLTPRSPVFAEAVKPMEAWLASDIWKKHCIPQGFHWIAAISYQYPHHKKTLIVFHYIKDKREPFHD